MTDEYEGEELVDVSGEKVGRVEASYEDESGTARYVEVKSGTVLGKRRLVPVEDLERADSGLAIPYEKRVVENSPDVSTRDDYLEDDSLIRVRAYYDGVHTRFQRDQGEVEAESQVPATEGAGSVPVTRGTTAEDAAVVGMEGEGATADDAAGITTASGQTIGEVRDLGDVIEIPIIEEQLVKRPVVKEVLRIRKTQRVETRDVGADVRREEVQVDAPPDQVVREERQVE